MGDPLVGAFDHASTLGRSPDETWHLEKQAMSEQPPLFDPVKYKETM